MSRDSDEEGAGGGGFFNYLPAILWARRWLVIVPLVLCAAAGIAIAVLLPTTYRSTATLLVESQALPAALVGSPGSAIIEQRIAKIRQQVLSRGDLVGLIEQNDLYPSERRSKPLSSVVSTMQQATSVHAIDNDLGGSQPGASNTIAFTMSFDYRDAIKAQAVMQSFVSRFLELDATNMEQEATNTVTFLQDQGKRLQDQITALESQITGLKARNGTALASTGSPFMSDNYQTQISTLQSANRQLLSQSRHLTKDPMVQQAEAQLAATRATYAENHPDVVRAKARLKELQELAKEDGPSADVSLIQDQIAANNQQIAALQSARASDSSRAASAVAAQSRAPVLMEQVMQLDGRANTLRSQYNDVANKLLAAQNTARMAREQKGEHLSVVETPSAPDSPIWPNRPLLIFGGIAAGLGIGLVLALGLELVLRPVRGVDGLASLGLDTLAVVPTFKTDGERQSSWWRRLFRDSDESDRLEPRTAS